MTTQDKEDISQLKEGHVLYKKAKIYYSASGRGRALVLLHGFMENRSMWNKFAAVLSKRYRVVCIDLPGHGQSDCLGYVHTMEEMADAVMGVLRRLRIRRASMVGHSMGGYVALAFGDRYPDALARLCLFFSHAAADSPEKKKNRRQAIQLVKQNHRSFIRKSFPRLFRHSFRTQYPEIVKAALTLALQTSIQGLVAALEGMRIRPSREIILKFSPWPVYVLAGHRDPVLPIKEIQRQMQLGERTKGFVIHEAGHMGHIETPEKCLQLLWEFMETKT